MGLKRKLFLRAEPETLVWLLAESDKSADRRLRELTRGGLHWHFGVDFEALAALPWMRRKPEITRALGR